MKGMVRHVYVGWGDSISYKKPILSLFKFIYDVSGSSREVGKTPATLQ